MWWRIAISLLLLGHGYVHAAWRTYGPPTSWVWRNADEGTLRAFSTTLFVLAAVGFFITGFGLFYQLDFWRVAAVLSSVVSMVLLVVFWNRGLMVGATIDLAILAAALWARWPSESLIGA